MRLSPGEYVFAVAPIHGPRGAFDESRYFDTPKDLYLAGSKWFFVEAVALTSGGGSWPSTSASQGGTHSIGTSVQALWAKAKADIDPSERPFAVGDRVVERWEEADKTIRTVRAVDDTGRGQYIWLEPVSGCHLDDCWAGRFVPAPVSP